MDYIKGFFSDGLAVTLVAIGFLLAALWEGCKGIWRASVPEGERKADEEYAASIEHFPITYITGIIAIIGVIGAAAIFAWGL